MLFSGSSCWVDRYRPFVLSSEAPDETRLKIFWTGLAVMVVAVARSARLVMNFILGGLVVVGRDLI